MAKFTAANGLDWIVSIDLGTVWDYKQAVGVDVLALTASGQIPVMDLLGLAYTSVQKQARKRGIHSCRDWLGDIGRGQSMPLAEAVAEELKAFFPDIDDGEGDKDSDPQPPARGDGKTS